MTDDHKNNPRVPPAPAIPTVRGVGVAPDATASDTLSDASGMPTGFHDGGSFGRFQILDILGAGGMGVVLAAHDPQLDRKVAIKVLRTRGLTAERREREAARLLQEARALAQLSHPHVVTVYEAGTFDERVFIAMEYIAGQTLRGALAERPHSPTEILELYLKAGRGLAAGHHAGIVHRDFKPDNVLVGNDGRVCVIDFGLARPNRGAADTPSADDEAPDGTPVYMAPEQHRRQQVDARADQFAFCVCLFQALYGRLPFKSETYVELAANVIAGEIVMPPDDPAIPENVVAAIVRGLRANPDERFASMDALLEALQPPVPRKRGRAILAAAIGAVAAAVITLVIVRFAAPGADSTAAASCAGGERRLAGVWDADLEQRVKDAFTASARSHATATFERVERELDRYAGDWVARRREVCEATRVHHERSETAFDLGMRCLDDRLAALRALTTLFAAKPDPQLTDTALAAAQQLRDPRACLAAEPDAIPLPSSEPQRRAIEELQREATEVRALHDAGKFAAAIDRYKRLLETARPLGYPPLEAELQFLLGRSLSSAGQAADAERVLREAVRVAALAKDDRLTARAYTLLVGVVGFQLARYSDGVALEPVAEVAIRRADGGDLMIGDLAYYVANTHFQKGDYDRARDAYQTSLALRTKAHGANHRDVAQVHNSLGGTLFRKGDLDEAAVHFEKALAIRSQVLGPVHPDVALPLANLGSVAQAQNRLDDATTYLERASKILEEVLGPEHVNLGLTVHNLGGLARERDDCTTALTHFTRALAILEKGGATHPLVALPLVGLAHCRVALGQPRDAIPEAERAIAILASQDPVQLAEARFALAKALWAARQDRARARLLANQARAAFTAAGPAGADGLAEVELWLVKR